MSKYKSVYSNLPCNNTCAVYQPHFNTMCFRPAISNQMGTKYNYIIVTCAPSFNGVWKYDADKTKTFETIYNGKVKCYQVPINECEKIKELKDLTNETIVAEIRRFQNSWINGEVKNNEHIYENKPDWLI